MLVKIDLSNKTEKTLSFIRQRLRKNFTPELTKLVLSDAKTKTKTGKKMN